MGDVRHAFSDMNDELRDLYQSVILDHSRKPRNFGELHGEGCVHVHGDNPSCGDEIDVYLKLNDGKIEDIKFNGQGCAISQASASMMTQKIKGKSRDQATQMAGVFRGIVTGKDRQQDLDGPADTGPGFQVGTDLERVHPMNSRIWDGGVRVNPERSGRFQ